MDFNTDLNAVVAMFNLLLHAGLQDWTGCGVQFGGQQGRKGTFAEMYTCGRVLKKSEDLLVEFNWSTLLTGGTFYPILGLDVR